MRNYATQMDAARRGIVTPEMRAVAQKEFRTEEEIRQYIGADSLHYISLEGLKRSLDCMDPEGMCYACFNAQYPDNAEETLRQGSKYIFENEG